MWNRIVDFVATRAELIASDYSIDPWIFIALLVLCGPFFYYSIFRVTKALARRDQPMLVKWGSVFLVSTSLPYLYVLLIGRNLPWWVYVIFAILLAQGVFSLIRKIASRSSQR